MDRTSTERGRLVEDGTHDALIKTGGRYASRTFTGRNPRDRLNRKPTRRVIPI
jgi:hypothetical protein